MQLSSLSLRQVLAFAVGWSVIAMPLSKAADSLLLTNAAQVRALARDEAAASGRRVELSAVITFSDITSGLLYAQDATAGIFVSPQARAWDWRVGQRVKISGMVTEGSHLPFINHALIEDLGLDSLPVPHTVTFQQLESDTEDANWVEISGVVHSARVENGQLQLRIGGDGKKLIAIFSDSPVSQSVVDDLVDAEVSVRGVCGMLEDKSTSPFLLRLHVPSLEHLKIIHQLPRPDIGSPTLPIGDISRVIGTSPFTHRVHVKGVWNGDHRIADSSGSIMVQPLRSISMRSNAPVEAFGFPSGSFAHPVLDDASVFQLGQSFPEPDTSRPNPEPELLPVLTQCQDIRHLQAKDSRRGFPVRIQGVVTCLDKDWNLFFVEDHSAGIYVDDPYHKFSGKMGDTIEVEGFTGEGKFAPIIREASFRALPAGLPVSKAKRPTQEELLSGELDAQLVEVEGIIRYVESNNRHLTLHLNSGGAITKIFIPAADGAAIPTNLIDAEVVIHGVFGTWANSNRQLTGVGIFVQSLDHVQIAKAPPIDPFGVDLRPIGSLMRFQPNNELRHRIRVRGSVTFRDPNYFNFFISDGSGSLYVRSLMKPSMAVGDIVDVVGFVTANSSGPIMSEAVFKRIGAGVPPKPLAALPKQIFSGELDSRLLTLKARYLEPVRDSGGYGIVCQADNWAFVAYLEGTQAAHQFSLLRPGCLVQLTGVCSRTSVSELEGGRMLLWLRSPDDLVVLANPAWTSAQLTAVLGLMTLILAVAAAWVLLLRKTVRSKTSALLRSETQLAAIYENTPIMMCLIDERNEVERMNRAMLEFFQRLSSREDGKRLGTLMGCVNSKLDPRGCGFSAQCVTCPIRLSILSTFQSSRSSRQVEQLFSFAWQGSQQEVWVSVSTALMRIENAPKVLVCIEDISARKRLEAQFLQAQKMEAVGQLAGGIAHDFNNILTAVIMNISNLRRNKALDPDTTDGLIDLEKDAFRAADLTRQLLLFSRRQAMSPRRLDMNDVVDALLKLLKRLLGENIEICPEYSPHPIWVSADRGMLEQLITNLCVNARDAMPRGGKLVLRVAQAHISQEQIIADSEARPGSFACLSVEDTGVGMDNATLKRIFEPFFTTKEVGKGTGLGLATVYGIVKQHHGWIEVQSVVDRGTTFHVYLPASDEAQLPGKSESRGSSAGGTETVLLVEDDASLRRIVSQVLVQHGYKVLEARSGVEALKVWQQQNGRIQLLLTDMVMPDGVSGLELANRLRQLKPNLKIVLSSGYSVDLQSVNPEKNGMRMLPKPYESETLLKVIRTFLDEKC